jgi:hypothetical protein
VSPCSQGKQDLLAPRERALPSRRVRGTSQAPRELARGGPALFLFQFCSTPDDSRSGIAQLQYVNPSTRYPAWGHRSKGQSEIMSRSKVIVSAVALLCAVVAGCTAGQTTTAPDPCVSSMAIGTAILEGSQDKNATAAALAAHVLAHPTCYKAETVAQARIALAQIHQQEQLARSSCPADVTYVC